MEKKLKKSSKKEHHHEFLKVLASLAIEGNGLAKKWIHKQGYDIIVDGVCHKTLNKTDKMS